MCSTSGSVSIPTVCQKVYRCCKLSGSTFKCSNSVGVKTCGWTRYHLPVLCPSFAHQAKNA